MILIFGNVTLHVTILGCLNTTQKPSARAWNITLHLLKALTNQEWASRRSNTCWFVFPIGRESTIKTLCLKAKRLINTFAKRLLQIFEKESYMRAIHQEQLWYRENALCYTPISINEFLASKNIPMVPQLPYLSDLSIYNLSSFWDCKITLRHVILENSTFKQL